MRGGGGEFKSPLRQKSRLPWSERFRSWGVGGGILRRSGTAVAVTWCFVVLRARADVPRPFREAAFLLVSGR
jgi:hypothetical protein